MENKKKEFCVEVEYGIYWTWCNCDADSEEEAKQIATKSFMKHLEGKPELQKAFRISRIFEVHEENKVFAYH